MKSPTLRLGPLPPIRISPGTLVTVLVLAVIIHPGLAGPGTTDPLAPILLSVAIALFMIVSVLVHESAHAISARAFGATVDHIALTLWGGHTQYRGEALGSLPSLVISLSGPVSNALLAALAAGAADLSEPGSAPAVFWGLSSWLNVALALFNLLPGLPMDGGRALEALLGAVLRSPLLGTRVTAWLGRGIAVLVVAYPLVRIVRADGAGTLSLLTVLWGVLIAGMLWQGASRALESANLTHRVETLDAAHLARPMRIVPPDRPLADLGAGGDLADVLVLEPAPPGSGQIGRAFRIDPDAAAAVPDDRRPATPASAAAAPVGTLGQLDASLRGNGLVTAMLARPVPAYLVTDRSGAVLGVIMSADVNALLRGR